MDFQTLSRKDLQALCKKNRIPANTTNVAMAEALQALQSVEGIAEIQGSEMLQSPKTSQKTTTRKSKNEDQASPLPRSRRVSARPPVIDDEEKKVASETPSMVNTRRRVSKNEESKGILGTTVARRTRQTTKKELGSEMVSTGVRMSTRAKGIKMSPLSKEEDEKDVEAEKLKAEAEKKLDEKELDEDVEADAQLESIEEKEAEIMVLHLKNGDNVDEKEQEGDEVVDQAESEEGKVVEAEIMVLQLQSIENDNIDEKEHKEEEVEDQAEPKEGNILQAEIMISRENGNVDEKEDKEPENLALQSKDGVIINEKEQEEKAEVQQAVDLLDEIMVNREDEGIAQEKQDIDHEIMVKETIVEDEAIDMEAKQEERIKFKTVVESAKIMIEEFNSFGNTNQADKEDSAVEDEEKHEIVVDYVEETTVENKEEGAAIDLEAKQGEMIEFKTEQEIAKIMIEEMNSLGNSKYTDKEENAEEDEAIVEGKQETAKQEVTVLEGAKFVKEELYSLSNTDHTDKDGNFVEGEAIDEEKQETDLNHDEETVVENQKKVEAIDVEKEKTDIEIEEMNSSGNLKCTYEITSEGENVEMPTDKANEVAVDDGEFSIQEFSVLENTETDDCQNETVELVKNVSDFKQDSESNENKENENMVSVDLKEMSSVMVNYENLSLRKLKSAYKEMIVMKNKGEEKRTALKAVNENCM